MTCLLGKLSVFATGRASFQGTKKISRDKFNLSTGERLVQGHIYVSGTKVMDKKILCYSRGSLENRDLPSAS